jgi:hypothetical protein
LFISSFLFLLAVIELFRLSIEPLAMYWNYIYRCFYFHAVPKKPELYSRHEDILVTFSLAIVFWGENSDKVRKNTGITVSNAISRDISAQKINLMPVQKTCQGI